MYFIQIPMQMLLEGVPPLGPRKEDANWIPPNAPMGLRIIETRLFLVLSICIVLVFVLNPKGPKAFGFELYSVFVLVLKR